MERGGGPLRAKDIDFLQRFFKKWLPFHIVKSSSLTICAIWHAANPGSYLGSTMNIHWNQALFGLHLLKWNSDTCHIQIKNSGAKKSDSLKQYKWKLVFKTWRTFSPLKSLTRWVAHLMHLVHCFIREGSGYQIRWFFGKIPNGLRPPHVWKLCCNFFMTDMVAFIQGGIGQIVWNACSWFPEIGTILRGGGQLPFGTLPKVHLIW